MMFYFTVLRQKMIPTIYIAQLDILAGVDTIGTNKEKSYKLGSSIPLEAIRELKPKVHDFSFHELLTKCLHGKKQNHNEAFNKMM